MYIVLVSPDPQHPYASFKIEPRYEQRLDASALTNELESVGGIKKINYRSAETWKIQPEAGEDAHELLMRLLEKVDKIGYSVSELIDNT